MITVVGENAIVQMKCQRVSDDEGGLMPVETIVKGIGGW